MSDEANATGPDARLLLGGMEASVVLHRERGRLVEEVVEAIVRSVPMYGDLPDEVVQVDVRQVVHDNLRTFEEGLLGGGLDRDALRELARSAYRRAEEGIPLQLVQGAYLIGARTAWQVVAGHAETGDEPALRTLASDVLTHLAEVFSVVSAAYLEELRSDVGEEHSRRSRLVRALLTGEGLRETARALEVELAEEYVVVLLALGPDEASPGRGPGLQVARRRTTRAMRAALLVDYEQAIAQIDGGGGVVLLPRTSERWWSDADADRLVARLAEAAGAVPVHAAIAVGATARTRAAADEAGDVLALVLRSGRPPGAYRMDDVLLDYQLSRPGPAADALRRAMAPLAGQEVLLETLRVHLAEEVVRSATAGRLHVHANTVDYRLGRIRALTGLDPSVPSHLTLLRAGLAVLDVGNDAPA